MTSEIKDKTPDLTAPDLAEDRKVPAYSVPKPLLRYGHTSKQWLVKCPDCGRIHAHGVGEGTRSPHCFISKYVYDLYYAGPLPPELWDEYKRQQRPKR